MKRNIKQFIIVLVLGTFSINANASVASNGTPKFGGIETKDNFSSFITKKASKFNKRNLENFNKYNEVVNLYYTSPVSFYNLSEKEQVEFKAAAENLSKSLNELHGETAKEWSNKVNLNKSIFDFIWSSKVSNAENQDLVSVSN